MKTYAIPHTNLRASRVAYGCGSIGGTWDTTAPTEAHLANALKALRATMAAGVNFYDHADIYCHGKSESVFGEALRELGVKREQVVLQTKCGIRFKDDPSPEAVGRFDFSYAHILDSVEASLKRLGTQYIDILLLHRPDALIQPEEVARAFDLLQKSGKVRHFGVSNHNVGQLELLRKYIAQPIVANQLQFSLLHTGLIDAGVGVNQNKHSIGCEGILDYCRLHNIQVQAWSSMANGRATGKWTDDAPPKPADELARVIAEFAEKKNVPPDAIALAWILRHPAGIHPIIGSLKPERIAAASKADAVELTHAEWYRLWVVARGQPMP